MLEEKKYWFPAKRYGWGWGRPTAWQGWLVYFTYFALMLYGVAVMRTHHTRDERIHSLIFVGALSAALVLICWLKGERPRWRWGE
jgi:lipoprotein signal peptidase